MGAKPRWEQTLLIVCVWCPIPGQPDPFQPGGGAPLREGDDMQSISEAGRSHARSQSRESETGLSSLAGTLGLGAALMYFLDPRSGRRRRALARDQLLHMARLAGRAQRVAARDLANRATGAWAEAARVLRHETASDGEVAGRVRAKLGRYVSHPHAVHVTVLDGCVTLSGPILEREVKELLHCVRHIPGVREIEDRLVAHKEAGRISALQGGVLRPGERSELFQDRWAPGTRVLVGALGSGLLIRGLRSGGPLGLLSALLGGGLLLRAAANREAASLLGMGRDSAIEVQKTVRIGVPVKDVFEFWADYSNFPHFMSRVREVRPLEDGRSRWIVSGPGGMPVEWTAEITRFQPHQCIEWRSGEGSMVSHHGIVRFDDDGALGTRVGIRLWYVPPAGMLGHAAAALFGADPKSEMDEDLIRMKTLIETGRTPHDASQPLQPRRRRALSGGPVPRQARESRPSGGGF
jgi:uncharacterized membrane protein/osmotically-inducible protein OsmY